MGLIVQGDLSEFAGAKPTAHTTHAATKKKATTPQKVVSKTTNTKKVVPKTVNKPVPKKVGAAKKAVSTPVSKTKAVHSSNKVYTAPKPVVKAATPVPIPPKAPSNQSNLSNGIQHIRLTQATAQGPARVNVIMIDPKTHGLEILPVLASNRMGAKSNVANMVTRNQAVAGINGSFFKPDIGIPLGILMINQELISGPIYDRVAMGITANNDIVMDRIRMAGEVALPNGQRIPIHNVNQPRVNPEHTVIYSSRWGDRAPKVPSNGMQILLRNHRVVAVSTSIPLEIPKDGVVISGVNSPAMATLSSLTQGQPVQLNVYTLPDWSGMKHAIGGGPWLVKDGRPFVDLHAQHFGARSLGYREPRSAVGVLPDGKLLLVAVDGRQPRVSVGMTLDELARLMQRLGCVQAMNLDGGSSTQMAVNGKIINAPSAGQIGVSNSLIVRQAGSDNVAIRGQKDF